MNIYISNRQNRIIASASNDLPNGTKILSDTFTDDVETGVKTLDITLIADEKIRESAIVGNFVLVGGTDLQPNDYLLFQIITASFDASSYELTLYCEDAGMDLINRIVGEWKPTSDPTLDDAVVKILGSNYGGWTINYEIPKTTTKGASNFDYSSEESALTRLQSVVEKFGGELFFSYDINGLDVLSRTINIVNHRGSDAAVRVFQYGTDVANIVVKKSIEELATAYVLYGADDKPLSKFGDYATYRDMEITPETTALFSGQRKHTYQVSGNTLRLVGRSAMWGSMIDSDGTISQVKKTEYKSAKNLISYALRELEKHVEAISTYDVEFFGVPEGIKIGDTIKIADDYDEIYLEARVLSWEYSDTTADFSATLGDFVELKGSKAQAVVIPELESKLAILSLNSSSGLIGRGGLDTTITATLYRGDSVITSSLELADGERLVWYEDGEEITDDRVDDFAVQVSISEGKTYTCELVNEEDETDE